MRENSDDESSVSGQRTGELRKQCIEHGALRSLPAERSRERPQLAQLRVDPARAASSLEPDQQRLRTRDRALQAVRGHVASARAHVLVDAAPQRERQAGLAAQGARHVESRYVAEPRGTDDVESHRELARIALQVEPAVDGKLRAAAHELRQAAQAASRGKHRTRVAAAGPRRTEPGELGAQGRGVRRERARDDADAFRRDAPVEQRSDAHRHGPALGLRARRAQQFERGRGLGGRELYGAGGARRFEALAQALRELCRRL